MVAVADLSLYPLDLAASSATLTIRIPPSLNHAKEAGMGCRVSEREPSLHRLLQIEEQWVAHDDNFRLGDGKVMHHASLSIRIVEGLHAQELILVAHHTHVELRPNEIVRDEKKLLLLVAKE